MSGRKYIGPYLAQPAGSVAEVLLSAQNAAISAQPLLGVNTINGLYRVSMMLVVTTSGTAGAMLMSCSCNNSAGVAVTYSLPIQNVLPAFVGDEMQAGAFVVDSNGSGDITYQVAFQGVTVGSLRYKIRIVAELLTAQ